MQTAGHGTWRWFRHFLARLLSIPGLRFAQPRGKSHKGAGLAGSRFEMGPIRDDIAALEMSGIGKIAVGAMHDPEVIPRGSARATSSRRPSSARPPSGRSTKAAPSTTPARHPALARGAASATTPASTASSRTRPDHGCPGSTMLTGGLRHAVPRGARRRGDPDRPLLAQCAYRLHHDGSPTRRRAAGRVRRALASRPGRGGSRGRARGQRPSTSTARPTRRAGSCPWPSRRPC